jgi:thymidylate synthase (FAD)
MLMSGTGEGKDDLELISAGPRLYVLSRPSLNSEDLASFLSEEAAEWKRSSSATMAEEIIELAGRICYMSFGRRQSPKSNAAYIRRLIEQQHESVLEHASWTLLLTGISRAFTHQIVRHRIGFSFSQLSQQYHDEGNTKFILPEEIRHSPAALLLWLQLLKQLRQGYNSIVHNLGGVESTEPKERLRAIRSAARSVLPNATETKIVFSANGRSLRHFLSTRGAVEGDMEMRKVAALIFSRLTSEAPTLTSDFELQVHNDGYPIVRHVK